MKLYPKCHPYIYDDNAEAPVKFRKQKKIAYTAQGYVVPCCWCDDVDMSDFEKNGLLDEELKLENVDKVDKILISKQWLSFHKTLILQPENAPTICKKKCCKPPQDYDTNLANHIDMEDEDDDE